MCAFVCIRKAPILLLKHHIFCVCAQSVYRNLSCNFQPQLSMRYCFYSTSTVAASLQFSVFVFYEMKSFNFEIRSFSFSQLFLLQFWLGLLTMMGIIWARENNCRRKRKKYLNSPFRMHFTFYEWRTDCQISSAY